MAIPATIDVVLEGKEYALPVEDRQSHDPGVGINGNLLFVTLEGRELAVDVDDGTVWEGNSEVGSAPVYANAYDRMRRELREFHREMRQEFHEED